MNLKETFNKYLAIFPEEESLLEIIKDRVNTQTDSELISRKNFTGHFATGAFLVCRNTKRVLLLEHKSLNKLMEPGGHIDETDANPLSAAYRELEEETGIKSDSVQYKPAFHDNPSVPFYIDVHTIPENNRKAEPTHYHFGIYYLFMVDSESIVNIDSAESNGYEWVDWDLFASQPHLMELAKKLEKFIVF
jgi:8-oxo-dGTP pyrophosphatase MutT (NUDIX family)